MKHFQRLLLASTYFVLLIPAFGSVSGTKREWDKVRNASPDYSTRDLAQFALQNASTHPQRALLALRRLRQAQDLNPQSPTFGNFPWYVGQSQPDDLNAGEFIQYKLIKLSLSKTSKLQKDGRDLLRQLIIDTNSGIERHDVKVSYTNICLAKIFNLIVGGETLGRADIAAKGRELFSKWIEYTRKNGIHEYLSPTYNGVDLDRLRALEQYTKDRAVKTKAHSAKNFLLCQLNANWFPKSNRLAGAHSRDYDDFLTGHAWLDGEISNDKKTESRGALKLPRLVWQRWGESPWEYCQNYVTQNYSISSSGASYGATDKPLAINFSGGPSQPIMTFFIDGRSDPYGLRPHVIGRSGHKGVDHLVPFIVSAQANSTVLFSATYDSLCISDLLAHCQRTGIPQKEALPQNIISTFIIPSDVEVWDSLKQIHGSRTRTNIPSTVFLRYKDVGMVLKILVGTRIGQKHSSKEEPGAPIYFIKDGIQKKAARIICEHSASSTTEAATIAFYIKIASSFDEKSFDNFRKRYSRFEPDVFFDGQKILVNTEDEKESLKIEADLENHKRISFGPTRSEVLSIDGGDDLSSKFFKD